MALMVLSLSGCFGWGEKAAPPDRSAELQQASNDLSQNINKLIALMTEKPSIYDQAQALLDEAQGVLDNAKDSQNPDDHLAALNEVNSKITDFISAKQ